MNPRRIATAVLCAPVVLVAVAGAETNDFLFDLRTDYSTPTPYRVEVADLNHDGYPDVVAANHGAATVTVRLNNGLGEFPTGLSYPTGASPKWVIAADLNGDGHHDLVTANSGASTLTLMFGDGTGAFGSRTDLSTFSFPTCVLATDLDRDGDLDLIATSGSVYGRLAIHHGDGAGQFGMPAEILAGVAPYSLADGDFNQDGEADIAVADHSTSSVYVLLGQGNGVLGSPHGHSVAGHAWGVAVGDLNLDGYPDIVSANDSSPSVSLLLGNGDGSFPPRTDVSCGPFPYSVAIGDLDGDGDADIAVTNDQTQKITILSGNGDGSFLPGTTLGTPNTPISVVLADLDQNGALDVAAAALSGQAISIYLDAREGTEPTSVTLSVEPSPSVYGQAVTLSATVTPDTLTGKVEFTDSGISLGSVDVSAGVASTVVTTLLHREHPLRARYLGSPYFAPSVSQAVTHPVGLASTSVALSTDPAMVVEFLPVRFQATASVVPPGGGTPSGTIQFRVDGVDFGEPRSLANGRATSDSTVGLADGAHVVEAVYSPPDTLRFAGSGTSLAFTVENSGPIIVDVRDVPNDQGGKVFVRWRCNLDGPGSRALSGYRVWRRVPAIDLARTALAPARSRVERSSARVAHEMFWEAIAELPAAALGSYGYTAATTQDSLEGSNPHTAFFIQALSRDPYVWFDSPPDSGYSVDNLAPVAPGPFTANYSPQSVALHWTASREPDLREYRLHRGESVEFVPGPANLIFAGPDTGYVDIGPSAARYYKLAAVDVHGNSSRYLLVYTEQPVAVFASLVEAKATADRIDLTWYSGGALGLVGRVERRTESSAWTTLGNVAQDGRGFMSYTDTPVVPGTRYGYRLALREGETESFTSTTWVTAEDLRLSFAGAWPNPVPAGQLRVRLTLPGSEPAHLELLDVTGRRLATREVGTLGAGSHDIALPEANGLRPGVYLLRLTHGNVRETRRVVLL